MKHKKLLSGFNNPKFKTFCLLRISKLIHPNIGKATLLALLMWVSGTSQAYSQTINMSASAQDPVTIETYADSWNDWVFPKYSEIWWYVDDVLIKVVGRSFNSGDYWIRSSETFKFENFSPGSTRKISAFARHENIAGGWRQTPTVTHNITMPAYQPVSNVKATQGKFQNRVVVTWDTNEMFTNQSYVIYANGVQVGTASKGVNTFSHNFLNPGVSSTYTVRGIVNGMLMPAPAGSTGSTFVFGLNASQDNQTNIALSWNNFSNTQGATGYSVERKNISNEQYTEIFSSTNIGATGYSDVNDLIPGFIYNYRVRVLPTNTSDVGGMVPGRTRPNGTISGRVTTPPSSTNPTGVGVPNIDITVRQIGGALPAGNNTTSNGAVYKTKTGADGRYEINNIYYFTDANFEVTPSFEERIFENAKDTVNLKRGAASNTANFTDKSSFTISGTVVQNMEPGKTCPLPGVRIELFGSADEYFTDSLGRYSIPVGSGGVYKLKPVLANHVFDPVERNVTVTANTDGVNFTDNTKAIAEGYFLASCNSYAGVATLRFYTPGNCFSKEVTTAPNTGKYSIELPAREYLVEVKNFVSFNENIVKSSDVLAYFFHPIQADLISKDTIQLDLTYRTPPQLRMEGIFNEFTCDAQPVPLLAQHSGYTLTLYSIEEFNGKTCPAGPGSITLKQNITSNNTAVQENIFTYNSGDTLRIPFEPGTPNRVAPHKKFIEAILNTEGYTENIFQNVIVTGHSPREQTFTTVTPSIPFHVIYNPPGDNSYSYLEKGQTISNTMSISYQSDGEEENFFRAQLLPTISLTQGIVSAEISAQLDRSSTNTGGTSQTTLDEITITTTATERFQTSANLNFTGEDGDVFIGAALNMIYGITDIVLYNRDECAIELSTRLVVSPDKFETTFNYTLWHVREVLLPELEGLKHYYLTLENDSAIFYTDQINVWKQVLDLHAENKSKAQFVENLSFSAGVSIEKSIESSRTSSNSIEFNLYINAETAIEGGASLAGVGIFGGYSVRTRINDGNITQNDTINSTTVGFVLADDDEGDSFTVDILRCLVHSAPVFKLISGKSSCPWEPGTLPREGVQLIANTYSQVVEMSESAVFILQLGNLSQSDEIRTYNLKFDNATNPNGASLTIGGSPIVGNLSTDFIIPPGAGINATITVRKGPTAKDYEGLKFTLQSTCDEQITDEIFLSVYFRENFNLTIAANGNGTLNVAPGVYTHKEGTVVNLFASPSQGHAFDKWVINGQEIFRQAIPVEMNANTTATAYFIESTLPQHTLTVEVFGNGTVNYPAGIHYLNEGTVVDLAALPDANNGLLRWEIDGVVVNESEPSVTITKDVIIKVYFIKIHLLTIDIIGSGTTNIASNTTWNDGSTVDLFATPALGYVFSKWTVNGVDTVSQNISLTMTEAFNVTAHFAVTTETQYKLSVDVEGIGQTFPPIGDHYFISGQTASLKAVPGPGQMFEKWVIGGAENTSNPVNVTITADVSVKAYFVIDDIAPVPDNAQLADVTAECEVAVLVAPTASDNAVGNVTGTHDAELPITTQGTTVVTWTYDDGNGNTTTQTQNVVIEDVTPPTLMCVGNATISLEAGETSYIILGTEMDLVNYSDNCGVKSVSNSLTNTSTLNDAILQVGQHTIEWKVIDIHDNESTCSVDVTVNALVGANDIVEQGIRLYPNPTSGIVQVKSDYFIHTIEVFDVTGRIVEVVKYQPQENPVIDISSFQSGIYFLNIKSETGEFRHRIVKN